MHIFVLISAFVVRCLDSVMSLVSVTKISNLTLTFVAEQASLSLTWSETPEDTFCRVVAHIIEYRGRKMTVIIWTAKPLVHCDKGCIEPQHDKTNKMACTPSEDSDHPASPNLFNVFAVLSNPLSAQQRQTEQTGRMPRLV